MDPISTMPPADATADWLEPTEAPPQPQPAPPPAGTGQPDHFLRLPDGTVFKTAEEVTGRLNELTQANTQREAQLAQLQRMLAAAAGGQQPAPQQSAYLLDALASAADNHDLTFDQAIHRVAAHIADQRVLHYLQPLMPLIEYANRNRAVERASNTNPNVAGFLRSNTFTEVMDAYPGLRDTIRTAEHNPIYEEMLPELYQIALNLGQTLTTQQAPIQATPPATTPAAPNVGGGTAPPPPAIGGHRDPFEEAWSRVNPTIAARVFEPVPR